MRSLKVDTQLIVFLQTILYYGSPRPPLKDLCDSLAHLQFWRGSFQANALSMSSASSDEGTVPQANGITRRLSDSAKLNGVIEDVDNKEEESSKRFKLLAKEAAETVVLVF
ncbi:hypothetical protein HN51_055074 [Arachis hypogaea]